MTPRKAGLATITGPQGQTCYDTLTCGHCNRVFPVRRSDGAACDPGGWCRVCMHAVCARCCGGACRTIEQRLEEMERRARFHRQVAACGAAGFD